MLNRAIPLLASTLSLINFAAAFFVFIPGSGCMGVCLGGWVLALATSSWFINTATGEPDIVAGVQTISLGLGAIVIVLGALPGLVMRERFATGTASAAAGAGVASAPPEPFWQSLRETLSNRPLWMLNGIVFFNLLGLVSTQGIGQYVNIYYVSRGSLAAASWIEGWKQTAMFVVGILSLPFWTWVSRRLDKKNALAIVLAGTCAGHALNLFCLDPARPYLQIVPSLFWSGVASAIWLLVPSMKMDIADHDELHTGRRREGSLNSVLSWFIKMAVALGVGASGLLLQATGFDADVGAAQPEAVLQRMIVLYICVPAVFWIPAFYFLWRYPLNRAFMADIRRQLEARRGVV